MEINLGGKTGGVAYVSEEDYEDLIKYSWHMNNEGYIAGLVNGTKVLMHRYIMKASATDIVDHADRVRHNNQRNNLELSTPEKNSQNRKKKENASSKYKGVAYNKTDKNYRTYLVLNGENIYLGSFKDEVDAAEAVDMYLVHHENLQHIELNFPDKVDEYLKREYVPYVSKRKKPTEYTGVVIRHSRYVAIIRVNGKNIRIGSSYDIEECAHMFDDYIVEHNIPNRTLNFPEDHPEYDPRVVKTTYKTVDETTIRLINDNLKDKRVLIDKDDYDKVKYFSWNVSEGYVKSSPKRGVALKLHRYLLDITDPKIMVDHIDNNPLNNTRSNLRPATATENSRNRKKVEGTSSKFIGVSRCSARKGWTSEVRVDKESVYIGVDKKEHHAARRHDIFILKRLPNKGYKYNFEWTKADIKKWTYKLYTAQNKKMKHLPKTTTSGSKTAKRDVKTVKKVKKSESKPTEIELDDEIIESDDEIIETKSKPVIKSSKKTSKQVVKAESDDDIIKSDEEITEPETKPAKKVIKSSKKVTKSKSTMKVTQSGSKTAKKSKSATKSKSTNKVTESKPVESESKLTKKVIESKPVKKVTKSKSKPVKKITKSGSKTSKKVTKSGSKTSKKTIK